MKRPTPKLYNRFLYVTTQADITDSDRKLFRHEVSFIGKLERGTSARTRRPKQFGLVGGNYRIQSDEAGEGAKKVVSCT